MYLKALETLLAVDGRLACNVKVLVEGEEELRADHLDAFMGREGERLRCDALVISDSAHVRRRASRRSRSRCAAWRRSSSRWRRPRPICTPGMYGGVAPNALDALVACSRRSATTGASITVDGFYDGVLAATEEELAEWQQLPFDEDELADADRRPRA